jgi:signal transduction histidine kinase
MTGVIRDDSIDRTVTAAFDSLVEPCFVCSRSGTLVYCNDRFEAVTGYDGDGNTNVSDCFSEAVRIDAACDAVLDTGEPTTVEATLAVEDVEGTATGSYELSLNRVETDDGVVGVAGIGRESTATDTPERLRRQNERLEEFASIVSHDLRNPLQVATAQLELARDECDSDRLDRVDAVLARIDRLIHDSLTLARSGGRPDDPADVDLVTQVESVWDGLDTAAATLDVEASPAELGSVSADPARFGLLLTNLLENAPKHGGPGVTVTVGTTETGFYVADDGPGLTVEDREYVFESGYSTSDDGTGFGLAIARRIARAHGWEVHATESDDGGARFEVTGVF